MIKKEPHRRICTRFSGHRFKIEKLGFHQGCFPEFRGKRKYLLSVLSKFIENSKILC